MNDLLTKALKWKVVVAKAALLVYINMATLAIATMQNWDSTYVSSLHWWNWFCIISAVLVSGCNTIVGFIDKTFHLESEKQKNGNSEHPPTAPKDTLVPPTFLKP